MAVVDPVEKPGPVQVHVHTRGERRRRSKSCGPNRLGEDLSLGLAVVKPSSQDLDHRVSGIRNTGGGKRDWEKRRGPGAVVEDDATARVLLVSHHHRWSAG